MGTSGSTMTLQFVLCISLFAHAEAWSAAFTPSGPSARLGVGRHQHSIRMASGSPLSPVIKVASDGMGLIKPIFGVEAKVQAAVLGGVSGVSKEDVVADIESSKKANKLLIYTYALSPFSRQALAILDASGYEYTNVELGLEWFTLGGRASQTRVALGEMVENGATSLPKVFAGGEAIGGASGFSALASLEASDELEGLLKKARVPKRK